MSSVQLKKPISVFDIQNFLDDVRIESTINNTPKNLSISSVADGRSPIANSICFLENINQVSADDSVLFIVPELINNQPCIVTKDPRFVFIRFLEYLKEQNNYQILPYGMVEKKHSSAFIHPKSTIEEGVFIDEGVYIGAGAIIKKGTVIGKGSIIRENTVIGCPGISLYKSKQGEVVRFPHLSGVIIGENVEIGANAVVAQGTLTPTIIENDVVIGNLCNIGHGVQVQSKVWMSVGTLIGGNCIIEQDTTLGLGVSVKDNLVLQAESVVGMGSVVTKSTSQKGSYFGNPAKPLRGIKAGPVR